MEKIKKSFVSYNTSNDTWSQPISNTFVLIRETCVFFVYAHPKIWIEYKEKSGVGVRLSVPVCQPSHISWACVFSRLDCAHKCLCVPRDTLSPVTLPLYSSVTPSAAVCYATPLSAAVSIHRLSHPNLLHPSNAGTTDFV